MTTKDILTVTIAGVGAGVALLTLIRATVEYRRQGRQKRAEAFFALRERLKSDDGFAELAALLDEEALGEDDAAATQLAALPFRLKRDYLGLFEEVALAMESGLIKPKVAHYMFGYYALLCWQSRAFWSNVNRLTAYWSLFNDFCERMAREQERFDFQRRDFRF